jgi:hypothetical protein
LIYRRTPPNPTKLLLRIVAGAGTGALVGMAACGSSEIMGSAVGSLHDDAGADDGAVPQCLGLCGSGTEPDAGDSGSTVDADEGGNPCANHVCGTIPAPEDAGGDATPSDSGSGDAQQDDGGPCHGGVCGVIVHLEE